jgi:membrane protein required for colicin V production
VTSVDYILIALAAVFIVRGLIKGLIREILGLISIIAGFVVAYAFSNEVSTYLNRLIHNEHGSIILAYAALFILTTLIINYFAKALTSLSKAVSLSFINRLLGGLFGFIKALLILLLIWYLVGLINSATDVELPSEIRNSQLIALMDQVCTGMC